MKNKIQNRIEELLMKVQVSEPTTIQGSNHIHDVFQILTEDEFKELSVLCEIQEIIEKYKSEKEKVISFNKEVRIDYENGEYESECDYVYDDTKGTYKLMMISQILEDLENITI